MASSNCCRICGKFDFDDNGEYLICRVCGEKRKKYRFPWMETVLCALCLICGVITTIFGAVVRSYRMDDKMNSGPAASLRPSFETLSPHGNSYNKLQYFLKNIEDEMVWVEPLIWLVGLALFVAAFFLIKKMQAYRKKTIL